MKNKRKIEDFAYISGHFFKDGYRHHFSSILGRFGLHFGMLIGVEVGKKETKKHRKNITAKKSCERSWEIPGDPGMDPVVL